MAVLYNLSYCLGENGEHIFAGQVSVDGESYDIPLVTPLVLELKRGEILSEALPRYFAQKHEEPVDNVACAKLCGMSPEEKRRVLYFVRFGSTFEKLAPESRELVLTVLRIFNGFADLSPSDQELLLSSMRPAHEQGGVDTPSP